MWTSLKVVQLFSVLILGILILAPASPATRSNFRPRTLKELAEY